MPTMSISWWLFALSFILTIVSAYWRPGLLFVPVLLLCLIGLIFTR